MSIYIKLEKDKLIIELKGKHYQPIKNKQLLMEQLCLELNHEIKKTIHLQETEDTLKKIRQSLNETDIEQDEYKLE